MTTFEQPSKHHFLRLRWVVMWTNDEEMELKFRRWQMTPRFMGGSEDLSALTGQEWDQIAAYFQAESLNVRGKTLNIPKFWLPFCS